jgi:hypothetical protein
MIIAVHSIVGVGVPLCLIVASEKVMFVVPAVPDFGNGVQFNSQELNAVSR